MTTRHASERLDELISLTRQHPQADFYRTRWGEAKKFEDLPTISRKDFLDVPLSQRRYKDARSLVKIVHDEGRMFLSEWSFEDIGREPWGIPSTRPMVYLSDPHEAVEKSMWCYENNKMPLIREKDTDIAMIAASKYRIDSLITDTASLQRFLPFLKRQEERLLSITIIGESFDPSSLEPFGAFAQSVRLVLRLPETGAFAESSLAPALSFTALPGCIVDEEEGLLVVTKVVQLVTPIIRYRTDLNAASMPVKSGDIV